MSRNHRRNHGHNTSANKSRRFYSIEDNSSPKEFIVYNPNYPQSKNKKSKPKLKAKALPVVGSAHYDKISVEIFGGFYFCVGDGNNG